MKDATAAAVYGVRAAAGVILVTTKRGTVQKPTVTVNSSVTLSQNTNFPEFLNGPDFAYWYNTAQRMDGVAEESLRFSADEIARIENPGPNEQVYGNTDWFDLLFKDVAPTYTNNVSVSGGPYDLNCWNQSTRSWGVEKGRIASTAYLNQWFTETEEYTIQPAIEYANNFGKHAVSGLFLYEFTNSKFSSLSAGR